MLQTSSSPATFSHMIQINVGWKPSTSSIGEPSPKWLDQAFLLGKGWDATIHCPMCLDAFVWPAWIALCMRPSNCLTHHSHPQRSESRCSRNKKWLLSQISHIGDTSSDALTSYSLPESSSSRKWLEQKKKAVQGRQSWHPSLGTMEWTRFAAVWDLHLQQTDFRFL